MSIRADNYNDSIPARLNMAASLLALHTIKFQVESRIVRCITARTHGSDFAPPGLNLAGKPRPYAPGTSCNCNYHAV